MTVDQSASLSQLPLSKTRLLVLFLGVVALFAAHCMALLFRIQPTVSLWFPPSGVAIALTLWLGPLGAIVVALVSFSMAPFWGMHNWMRLISLLDTAEPLVAWMLYVQCFRGSLTLKTLREAIAFLLSAPFAACAISALVGCLVLYAADMVKGIDLGVMITHWWVGNAIGTLAIAPPLLILLTPHLQRWGLLPSRGEPEPLPELEIPMHRHWIEIILILNSVILFAWLTVEATHVSIFATLQFSILSSISIFWAVIRFGSKGGVLIASFNVFVTLLAYLLIYPNAIFLPQFPVNPELLHLHKLSLLLQCAIGLVAGTAITERANIQVALAVEQVRLTEAEARAQLSQSLFQLNRMLTETNQQLRASKTREQNARQQAESASRMKDEFLAIVSHELRSPLNAMLGWSRLLRTRKLDEATISRALESIERNAQAQTQLIEDLLDISRIIRGKVRLHPRPLRLAQIVDAAIDTIRPTAGTRQIEVTEHLDSAVEVLGDSDRLQQVIWNLLSNAVKFTPSGGRVDVRLERVIVEDRDDGGEGGDREDTPLSPPSPSAQITITDTGKGIHPDFLPHVFDRFRQEDGTTTRTEGGLGLGLAIVRHLVELHGGQVLADSRGEGLGSTFTVQLPLITTDSSLNLGQNTLLPTALAKQSLNGMKVLIVDDDADTREFLTAALMQYEINVLQASSVQEAFHLLQHTQPDILLSDIGMPDEDGYKLIRLVRSLPPEEGGRIPAAALTAYVRENDRSQALAAGFDLHLAKPIDPIQLIEVMMKLAGRVADLHRE
jgi:signal transduction histidine kinase/ActR/RegA family two-component response regulator